MTYFVNGDIYTVEDSGDSLDFIKAITPKGNGNVTTSLLRDIKKAY